MVLARELCEDGVVCEHFFVEGGFCKCFSSGGRWRRWGACGREGEVLILGVGLWDEEEVWVVGNEEEVVVDGAGEEEGGGDEED